VCVLCIVCVVIVCTCCVLINIQHHVGYKCLVDTICVLTHIAISVSILLMFVSCSRCSSSWYRCFLSTLLNTSSTRLWSVYIHLCLSYSMVAPCSHNNFVVEQCPQVRLAADALVQKNNSTPATASAKFFIVVVVVVVVALSWVKAEPLYPHHNYILG